MLFYHIYLLLIFYCIHQFQDGLLSPHFNTSEIRNPLIIFRTPFNCSWPASDCDRVFFACALMTLDIIDCGGMTGQLQSLDVSSQKGI